MVTFQAQGWGRGWSTFTPIRETARLLSEFSFYLVSQKRSFEGVWALAGEELGCYGEA